MDTVNTVDTQVLQVREIDTTEMKRLQKQLAQMWAAQVGSNMKVASSYVKSRAWMAANKFTKIVNKVTSQNVSDLFMKGGKLAAGITICAAALAPGLVLPAIAAVGAKVTLGSFMMSAITKAINKLNGKAMNKTAAALDESNRKLANAKADRNYVNSGYEAAKSLFEAEKEAIANQRKENRKARWEAFKQEVRDDWELTKEAYNDVKETVKQSVKNATNKVKTTAVNVKNTVVEKATTVKNAVKGAANKVGDFVGNVVGDVKRAAASKINEANIRRARIEAERKAAKQAQEAARKEAEKERAKAKKEKRENRSKKCLNFLTRSSTFLGKDFIAEHLLEEEDKKFYDEAKRAAEEAREERVQKINEVMGTTYTAKDVAKMSDKQITRIEDKIKLVEASRSRAAVTAPAMTV